MKRNINYQQAMQMIRGSSIYSTGGGYDESEQIKMFKTLFKNKKLLSLMSLDEFDPNSYICTAYMVGSAGKTNYNPTHALKIGLKELEKHTGKKFVGIFAGETNIDNIVFQAAYLANLPVVDADCTGGRAVPEIKFDNFALFDKSILPLVAVTATGNVVLLTQAKDLGDVERFVRNLLHLQKGGLITVLDHSVSVREAKQMLTRSIFTRSLRLGEYLNTKAVSINDLLKKIPGKLLLTGTVSKVSLKDTGEFLIGYYDIKNAKATARVFVKNENIMCYVDGKIAVAPPDALLTIDTQKWYGVHNGEIRKGQKVAIIKKLAPKIWHSTKGKRIFNKKQFMPLLHAGTQVC